MSSTERLVADIRWMAGEVRRVADSLEHELRARDAEIARLQRSLEILRGMTPSDTYVAIDEGRPGGDYTAKATYHVTHGGVRVESVEIIDNGTNGATGKFLRLHADMETGK